MENLNFPTVKEVDKSRLEREFTETEVWDVVRKMGCNKAPGPDGFTAEFFKSCWSVIKEYLMNLIKDIHKFGSIDWRFNCSFVTLIPKKEDFCTPKDFRPLTLIGSVYKIVSKLLAVRLKKVMPDLISDFQARCFHSRKINS